MTIQPTPQALARICLPIGALTIGAGAMHSDTALAIGGLALVIMGLTGAAVHVLARIIRDTTFDRRKMQRALDDERRRLHLSLNEERQRLQRAIEEVEADRARYLILRASTDAEAEALCRLGIQMERDTAATLAAEREEMLADLEDKRSAIMNKGFQIGLDYNDRGVLKDALYPRPEAQVIQLRGTVGSAPGQGAYSPS